MKYPEPKFLSTLLIEDSEKYISRLEGFKQKGHKIEQPWFQNDIEITEKYLDYLEGINLPEISEQCEVFRERMKNLKTPHK